MTRVVVVEHEPGCPPAYVGTWLTDAGCAVEVCRPWAGDELPAGAVVGSTYDALVVLGGSMGANDDDLHHWLGPLKALVRDCVAAGTPLLGICLGHQLIAAALGGTVERDPYGQQVGLYDVGWLAEAQQDELVTGLGAVRGIQWNHDLVTALPDGATALARTPQGELQVARFAPRAWGIQLHPEADEHIVGAWADGDREEHLDRGLDQAALLGGIARAREELDAAWRPLVTRFAELAG